MSQSSAYLYLALYHMQKSHRYHWAFLVSPQDVLNDPVDIFQIIQNGGPWENGHQDRVFLMDASQSKFVCCIPLSSIDRHGLQRLRQVLLEQSVERYGTPLTPPHPCWSCEQWCMRTLERLIQGRHVAVQFNTQHPKWKEMFNLNVIKTGDRALYDSGYGSHNGQVRVIDLVE